MHMRTLILAAAGVFAVCAPAAAQTPPGAPAGPPGAMNGPGTMRAPFVLRSANAALPLTMAYRAIGHAEQAGATGHLVEAARTHYRGAMARYGKNDATGAAAEARLASDLARAALDERPIPPMPAPRDLPTPPALPSMPGMPPGGPGPGMSGMEMPRMGMMHGDGPGGFHGNAAFGMHRGHGFDAMRLAEEMKIESGSEAKQLAQAAVDANAAAQRAALAGNVAETARQTRLSSDLMAAVSSLVALNHPELRRSMPRIQIQREMRSPG
jgi:hypothetical protein